MTKQQHNGDNPQRRLGIGMTIGMWLMLLALLTLFFQSWQERQHNPNQKLSITRSEDGGYELVLQRNRYGHYVASGLINGESVVFLLDTGASDISVPSGLAQRLGLERGPAMLYQTANGTIKVYATQLASVTMGGITLHQVRASINPAMDGDEVLLGMSFLKHLDFSQRGDTLTLRAPAR
jgi:aspartyl protease family protein